MFSLTKAFQWLDMWNILFFTFILKVGESNEKEKEKKKERERANVLLLLHNQVKLCATLFERTTEMIYPKNCNFLFLAI